MKKQKQKSGEEEKKKEEEEETEAQAALDELSAQPARKGKGNRKGKGKREALDDAEEAGPKVAPSMDECAHCGTLQTVGQGSFKRCSRCKLVR